MLLKMLIALVLLAHGIGHSIGLLQVFRVVTINPQWHGESWLLGPADAALVQPIGVAVWSVSIIGFALLAGVVIGWLPAAWWVPLALASAASSLLGVVLFPLAFPPYSTVAAAALDVALIVAVSVYHWAPTDLPA